MSLIHIVRYLVAAPPAGVAALKQAGAWDVCRRKAVAAALGRMFRRVGGALCEPGGLPRDGIHRVLVCRPNHRLGNSVLISPLISEIEALYPGAEIDVLGSHATETLSAERFRIHQVFVLPRKIARHPWTSIRALRALRRCRYDLAIDACNGSQSGRIVLAMAQARYKLGFPDPLLNPASAWHALAWPDHLAHRGVFLLRKAYAGVTASVYPPLNLEVTVGDRCQAAAVLTAVCGGLRRQPGATVAIFPNATGAKCYGEQWWAQFVDTFQSLCPQAMLVDLLAAHGRSQLGSRLTPFYSQNLRRLAAMIACMDGFISADCGVMHLAAASGTPTLGLFSVTDPVKYAPYGGANAALDTREMSPVSAATAAAQWFGAVMTARANADAAMVGAERVVSSLAAS
ncbi:MAG TPA: glycosyltransferase family 9 protein [Rhodanobacter sp.]|nr:glycosyltransferase family 9 protein [Rhodanobacter sp.]